MVSVGCIIPVYINTDVDHLDAALSSVFCQTVPVTEIIISIDGAISTELSQYLNKLASERRNVKTVISIENKGAGAARNLAIATSQEEYLMFLDSDDLCAPIRIQEQLEFIMEHGLDGCYCNMIRLNGADRYYIDYNPGFLSFSWKTLLLSPVSLPSLFVKRTVLQNFHFPEHIRVAEDYWLFLLMMVAGIRLGNVGQYLYYYNLSEPDLVRRRGLKNSISDIKVRLNFLKYVNVANKFAVILFIIVLIFLRFLPKNLFSVAYKSSFWLRKRFRSVKSENR